ncbi:MAG: transposase [Treponema sp.]|nr:transposase [Treponema sp.]
MDEQPAQLPGEKREDNGYARKGTCRVFMAVEPLGGKRYVSASARRTRQDWAREAKPLVTDRHPQAEKVVLAMDNLNAHTLSSLYEIYPAQEAFAIAQKLEIQYAQAWLSA